MSGWHSLSGYLYYRTGGTLSILKSRKRQWYMFEESQCQLLYYNTEADARKKPPIGQIDIKGAAISLALEQQNQFVIISDKKDHIFTADNHESLMIWLIGLQAKRDACLNNVACKSELKPCHSLPMQFESRKRSCSDLTPEGQFMRSRDFSELRRSHTLKDRSDLRQIRLSNGCMGESFSNGYDVYNDQATEPILKLQQINRPVSRSVTTEDDRCSPPPLAPSGDKPWQHRNGHVACDSSDSGSPLEEDEVFRDHNKFAMKSSKEKLGSLHHLDMSPDNILEDNLSRNGGTVILNGYDRTSSCSGLSSGSADSAIDKGHSEVHQELNSRLTELEHNLISTKCELAKVLNQQTCFTEMLEKKDAIIYELDQTLDQLGVADIKRQNLYGGKFVSTKKGKLLEERVRVLQNQNRFLNEEVKRLAKIRHNEQDKYQQQQQRLEHMEAEIMGWKRKYVSVIQSCIHYPTGDSMDGAEVNLYGEEKHKATVQDLLCEARTINPSLPTFERLVSSTQHVDNYGFKHSHEKTGLLIHYICQQLTIHYTMQLASYEAHQLQWKEYLCQHRDFTRSDKELKQLCRSGIPHQYRKEVWRRLVYTQVKDLRTEKGPHYFRNLCNSLPDSQLAARYRKQISLDLMRTMPSNVKFSSSGSKGIRDLQDVLLAFCIHNPSVGYCQGLNFIVALSLLILDPQDAFWTLVAVTEKYFSSNYFNQNLIGAQADQEVLREIILDKLPKLYHHLEDIDIEISTVTLNWFMAIFFDSVPFETLLRLWDCFLLEGPKVLFRFSLAILKLHENDLLHQTDTISVMRHLKACAKLTYDVDGLIKTAYDDLGLFPRRRDISVKQTCYLNVLKEKYRKREWHKRAYVEREQMLQEQKADAANLMVIQCLAAYDDGKLWLSHSEQDTARICKVNCAENMMYDLSVQFDARILCMTALREDVMLIGTVAWTLFAYDTRSREEKWKLQLHDAVLSVCVLAEGKHRKVFAALADGTVAVIENVRSTMPKKDIFYVPVGRTPVTSLTLLNDQLWCASGNMVYILHARTLDAMDNFTVSVNPYDQVLTLVPGEYGIWISLKGSSILELWDTKTLSCKMLYDTRAGRYPNLRKEDDMYFNKDRITSVHSKGSMVWVGTGEGALITYDVLERLPGKVSPDGSSAATSRSSSPQYSTCHKELQEKFAAANCSQDRVKEYIQKLESSDQGEVTGGIIDMEGTDWDKNSKQSGRLSPTGGNTDPIISLACTDNISSNFVSSNVSAEPSEGKDFNTESRHHAPACRKPISIRPTLVKGVTVEDLNATGSFHTPTGSYTPPVLTSSPTEEIIWPDGSFSEQESGEKAELTDLEVHREGLEPELEDCDGEQEDKDVREDSTEQNENSETVNMDDMEENSRCEQSEENVIDVSDSGIPEISEDLVEEQNDHSEKTASCESGGLTRFASSESFLSCASKDDYASTIENAGDRSMDTRSEEDFVNCASTTASDEFFEDDVFFEAYSSGFPKVDVVTVSQSVAIDKFMPEAKSSPLKNAEKEDAGKDKTPHIRHGRHGRKRYKKITAEIQYRLDFSDMKVKLDSTMSSSSLSDKKSSCPSTSYNHSDASWDPADSRDTCSSNNHNIVQGSNCMVIDRPDLLKGISPVNQSGVNTPPIIISSYDGQTMESRQRLSSIDRPLDSMGWSSFEEISSHQECDSTADQKDYLPTGRTLKTHISHNSSCTSLCSLTDSQLYAFDLNLLAKVKIADKPVKCLVETRVKKEPIIVSCAGSYDDDEAVLKWRKDKNEKLWTNEPVFEICPTTNTTRLPSYMRGRLSSTSSTRSGDSGASNGSVIAMPKSGMF